MAKADELVHALVFSFALACRADVQDAIESAEKSEGKTDGKPEGKMDGK
jgi:hypothetical protein